MDAPIIIDNKLGTVRGIVEGTDILLWVKADTPKFGPFRSAFKLSGPMQTLYFYSVMLNLEMQFFSLISRRADRSGFTLLADLEQAHVEAKANGSMISRDTQARALGTTQAISSDPSKPVKHEKKRALFEGELMEFRTESTARHAGVEIRSKFDARSLRYRVFFSVLNFQTRALARFDMNVGEIRAFKTLAERALSTYETLEVVMLDDIHTLSVTMRTAERGLRFDLRTPYTAKTVMFHDAHNLATLSFWCERALAYRGNPLIAFRQNGYGMMLWEHAETLKPYARFFFKEKDEIMNLTRLNLCSIKLFSGLVLWRQIYRKRQPLMEIANEEKDICKEIVV